MNSGIKTLSVICLGLCLLAFPTLIVLLVNDAPGWVVKGVFVAFFVSLMGLALSRVLGSSEYEVSDRGALKWVLTAFGACALPVLAVLVAGFLGAPTWVSGVLIVVALIALITVAVLAMRRISDGGDT